MNALPQPRSRIDPMDRARRHIEENLDWALCLGDLAEAAHLSPYPFTRLFTGRYGHSPMAYVRSAGWRPPLSGCRNGRRTTLIDLALDFGFESQEGFTRAFSREFGISPGRYRDGERPPRSERVTMHTEGLPTANLTQSPALWGEFAPRLPFPGQADSWTFGVCFAGPGGKGVPYIAGATLADGASAPEGFEVIELPPQAYLVFRQVLNGGPLHPQMQAAVREIWGERGPNSGCALARGVPDLEVYPDNFEPDRAGAWVGWWIPVEG